VTDDELKQLAKDIHGNRVFTIRHIRPQDLSRLLGMVFMPLSLMNDKHMDDLTEKLGEKGMVYEYLSEAGPRAVNGYPVFFSLRAMDTDETEKVWGYVKELKELESRL